MKINNSEFIEKARFAFAYNKPFRYEDKYDEEYTISLLDEAKIAFLIDNNNVEDTVLSQKVLLDLLFEGQKQCKGTLKNNIMFRILTQTVIEDYNTCKIFCNSLQESDKCRKILKKYNKFVKKSPTRGVLPICKK